MSSEERILHQIIKASDVIHKKHRMLKRGKEAIETSMKEVFEPIVITLQEMTNRTPAQSITMKEEVPSIKQELPVEDQEEDASTMRREDDLMSFQSISEHTIPTFTTSSPIVHKETDNLSKYVDDTSVMIRTLQSQCQESLKNQRINNETVQDLAAHNSRVITQLDERLRGLERSRENDDNSSTIRDLESSIKEAIKRLDIKQKADTEALQDLEFRKSQIISRLND